MLLSAILLMFSIPFKFWWSFQKFWVGDKKESAYFLHFTTYSNTSNRCQLWGLSFIIVSADKIKNEHKFRSTTKRSPVQQRDKKKWKFI